MFRAGAARTFGRSLASHQHTSSAASRALLSTRSALNGRVSSFKASPGLALTLRKPTTAALVRYASGVPPIDAKPDTQAEAKVAQKKLPSDPAHVTESSSIHPVFGEQGVPEGEEKDTDMMAGINADLKTIRETFSLQDVPKQALYIGMAGVVPYVATSLSTVFLGWNINHAAHTGTGLFMSGHTAEQLLHVIEPIQVGYGACILSFLGAIHWGLEWAKFGGEFGYRRYAPGVIAPALAWPTTFLPIEYALIAQFLAFNYLYYVDSRSARFGLAPRWYGVYRYVLTFVVGASIVLSLVGRGQIQQEIGRPSSMADRFKALRDTDWEKLEEEERAKNAEEAAAAENEEDEEEEGEGDKEEEGDDEEGGDDE